MCAMRSLKFTAVGDGAVGKTALLFNYTTNQAYLDYQPTVFDTTNTVCMYKNEPLALILYDSAGQEEFSHLRVLSYPGTDAFLLCYSTISRVSLENAKSMWVHELRKHCPDAPIILVGTKTDLRDDPTTRDFLNTRGQTVISTAQGEAAAKEIGAAGFIEICALRGENVREAFEKALDASFNQKKRQKKSNQQGCACEIM